MLVEPISTIKSPIYRDISETLNKTLFELYVPESYQPVVHGYYLDHPDIPPIHTPEPFESGNMCFTRLPLINIIDMLVTGQEFRWAHSTDIRKAADFLRMYIKQFERVDVSKDAAQKAFLEKAKHAEKKFRGYADERDSMTKKRPKKRLSLIERLKLLGF